MNGGIVVYPMVDASPQGGRDWEMIHLTIVLKRSLAGLHRPWDNTQEPSKGGGLTKFPSARSPNWFCIKIRLGIKWMIG